MGRKKRKPKRPPKPTLWTVPKLWPGRTVYLLGGGPSLRKKAKVPPRVRSGDKVFALLAHYLSPIHGERVLAVNQAFRLGHWVDACFFGDRQWYRWNAQRLAHWGGLLMTCVTQVIQTGPASKRVKYLGRGRTYGLDERPDMVTWNKNSGAAAINLAYHFGAARIVLVGFDGEAEGTHKKKRHHFHDDYPDMGPKFNPYGRWSKTFNRIQLSAERLGVEIINSNPDSAIMAFPKVPLEDLW